jgi:hypothetical protein
VVLALVRSCFDAEATQTLHSRVGSCCYVVRAL